MAYSTVPKTKRDGKIELVDGTGSPVILEIAYEDGNFSFSEPNEFSELVVMTVGTFPRSGNKINRLSLDRSLFILDNSQMEVKPVQFVTS